MKWNIYQPTTFIPLAMILMVSCQSKVQEDNTAYERFKQRKLKEKDSISVQENTASKYVEATDTLSTVQSQSKVNAITAMAKVSQTIPETESDAIDYNQSSAEIPKIQKVVVLNESSVPESSSHKKVVKQKKHIEWPKINKITIKKKKKRGAEEVG